MLKNYKFALLILCTFSFSGFAQNSAGYKEVLLDEKPARLNVVTGEVTLLKPNLDAMKIPVVSKQDSIPMVKDSIVSSIGSKSKRVDGVPKLISDSAVSVESEFHIVKKGETLYGLAKKYNISINVLKQANNLKTTIIDVGQNLRVSNFHLVNDVSQPSFFTVKKGDTLYSISKKLNTSVNALKMLNNLKSDVIYIGQKLKLE